MKVVTIEQMREIERRAAEAELPSEILMENAGLAVAREVKNWVGTVAGRRILLLIGPGNNGGDGLVAARHLHDWGADVHLCLLRPRANSDPNYLLVRRRGIHSIVAEQPDCRTELGTLLATSDVVIDSLFGTGKARPLEGASRWVLECIREARTNGSSLQVVAVDLPSGLNADTGAVDDACVSADLTITLGYPKHGLFIFPGAARLGTLRIADIGIPAALAEDVTTELITPKLARTLLPARPPDANKGTFGRVIVAGGSVNYIGAVCLACAAATRVGAGLVTLAIARSLHPIVASKLTEVTYLPLPESEPGLIAGNGSDVLGSRLPEYNTLLLGCGLGQSQSAQDLVESVLFSPGGLPSVILDADALNILSRIPQWWQKLTGDAVLTPHPGEMSRLTGLPVSEIQANRLSVAREAATSWHETIVLKGAHTVIAFPDGRTMINPSANPGLASAGTGDVLAGAIAGLAAQGLSLENAAVAGTFLHSQAGVIVRGRTGDAGMTAGDLLPILPLAIKMTKAGSPELEQIGG